MTLPKSDALHNAIAPRLKELSPMLKKAADYIMSNPDKIAMQSLRQVAAESKLAPATFSRLVHSLKLENYESLRELCRNEVRLRNPSYAEKVEILQQLPGRQQGLLLQAHAVASIKNIEDILKSVDDQRLSAIADILTRARTVYLVGSLSSGALMDYIGFEAQMALDNWRVIMRNHNSMAMSLPDISKKDAILILCQYPYCRRTVEAARAGANRQAKVVVITDAFSAPITEFASQILLAPTDSPHFFSSRVATIFLLETLINMVVQRTGKKAQRRIAEVEDEHNRLGEYWQE
jgi:DNA-binding MurR/RpiR family transcriptional regulator